MPFESFDEAARLGCRVDQVVELRAFLRAQPHNVFLDGNLFRGHESPPALATTEIQKIASDSMT